MGPEILKKGVWYDPVEMTHGQNFLDMVEGGRVHIWLWLFSTLYMGDVLSVPYLADISCDYNEVIIHLVDDPSLLLLIFWL